MAEIMSGIGSKSFWSNGVVRPQGIESRISLRPMGTVDGDVLQFLEQKLSMLGKIDLLPSIQLPENAYNPLRRLRENPSCRHCPALK